MHFSAGGLLFELGTYAWPARTMHVKISLSIPLGGRIMLQYFNYEDERKREGAT